MKVEIWSDVACPWCHVGKRRFEEALSRFPHRDRVEVVWRSFELDPRARPDAPGDYAERLARKYGTDRDEAFEMLRTMTETAASVGLDFRFERAPAVNTFDAHRLLHLARERGRQDALKERLLAAYFSEGLQVSDPEVLVGLAAEVGLDADEVRDVLAGDAYAGEVRRDEREAVELGVRGVPFFVVDRRYGASGAQPPEHLLEVLERAWAERRPLQRLDAGAAACGPDGCAV